MILRLDPAVPVVWRSPTAVQLGVDRVIGVFDGASGATERLLAALAVGVPESALPIIAEQAGVSDTFAQALLETVRPALLPENGVKPAPPPQPAAPRIAVDGEGPGAGQLAAVLRGLGVRLTEALPEDRDELDAAVVVGAYAIRTSRHGAWLRRDVPHLGVVFGERGVRIGPFVEPGVGPCLACLDLARADDDPAWPVIASQLQRKRAPVEGGPFLASVTLRIARLLLDRLTGGARDLVDQSLEIGTDARETLTRHRPHDRCGCRALPGTAMADVLQLSRFRSRSNSAAAAASLG